MILLYQVGIANVFVESPLGKLTRIFQGDYYGAEKMLDGAHVVGAYTRVMYWESAGDAALHRDEWLLGKGYLWQDKRKRDAQFYLTGRES
jgi:hypothetical protein